MAVESKWVRGMMSRAWIKDDGVLGICSNSLFIVIVKSAHCLSYSEVKESAVLQFRLIIEIIHRSGTLLSPLENTDAKALGRVQE